MNLPFFIAKRYLFARKSHNVINIISAISAAGMAVGTAALIIILSVYNGFDSLVKSSLSDLDPDILITPSEGKTFVPEGDAFDWAYTAPEVFNMCSVLQENVFVNYDSHQGIATAKGVDSVYEEESLLRTHVRQGEFKLHFGEMPMCAVGAGLAYKLDLNTRFVAPLEVYFPARDKAISLANPTASIKSVKARPSCIFSVNAETDESLVLLPLESMRELLGYRDEVSAVEIRLVEGLSSRQRKAVFRTLEEKLGDGYRVLDRFQQNESLYKMMKYEKVSIFLILIFIIFIIAFNIFGSLSMLIIEKTDDISTFRSLGATESLVDRIFVLEGWLISLLGLVFGLLIGLAFAFLQQRFGFIKMPGNFMVSAYPVIIQWGDILLTTAGVAVVGYLIALFPVLSRKK